VDRVGEHEEVLIWLGLETNRVRNAKWELSRRTIFLRHPARERELTSIAADGTTRPIPAITSRVRGIDLTNLPNINFRDLELQLLVNERLNQAVENGYDESKDDPKLVAQSLADEDSDIERLISEQFDGDETILIPFIKVWQQKRLA
jgi:hypothetical protein